MKPLRCHNSIISGHDEPFNFRGVAYLASGSQRIAGDGGSNWLRIKRADGKKVRSERKVAGEYIYASSLLEKAAWRALDIATTNRKD